MNTRAIIVVHEGPDGSGKETQTTLLCARLAREGIPFHRVDFPTYGEDPVADCILLMLRERKEEWNLRSWESKALLYASNRHRFFTAQADLLREPLVLVCNRYVPSNQAYMAAYVDDETEWHRRIEWIAHLEYEVLGLLHPDVVFLHTMPGDTRTALLEKREQGRQDAHERDRQYLTRVEGCYRALAARDPARWRHIPADRDGNIQSPEDVHTRVWAALRTHSAWYEYAHRAMVRSSAPAS